MTIKTYIIEEQISDLNNILNPKSEEEQINDVLSNLDDMFDSE